MNVDDWFVTIHLAVCGQIINFLCSFLALVGTKVIVALTQKPTSLILVIDGAQFLPTRLTLIQSEEAK
ncbi:hypothetical protein AQUCO_05800181v1 [Aquilegia coerulea]|uniref:Uncharacterized protein n=1 Tax=Aquilegia coerulea TaxID=218851 RepID=A0A2G5CF60_AQUCA|nr:hypothetical protein AQUCO_05800181v1 [Aquilegia coerulea]